MCAATRSALLSGRYAWRTGLDYQVTPGSVYHTDGDMTLFPEVLRNHFGYNTVMLGKWHIGYKDESLLPFNRGFDAAIFFTNAGQKYYDHTVCCSWVYFDEQYPDLDSVLKGRRNAAFGSEEQCAYDLWDENYDAVLSDEYNEDIFTAKLTEVIRTADPSEPFFAYYAMLVRSAL